MSSPSMPQPAQRLERLVDLCDSVLNGELPSLRHERSVVALSSVFYPRCSCGWLGTPCMWDATARWTPCEVETLLTDSAERARLILRG